MEELLNRQMPHSTQAEQAVLGSLLIDARCIPDVVAAVKPDDFYNNTNREIFETIFTMFNYSKKIDAVTVLEEMKLGGADEGSTAKYLMELMDITPTAANVMEYVQIICDKALLRGVAQTADEINTMVYDGSGTADEVLEAAEKKIFALRRDKSVGGLEPVSTVLAGVYSHLMELAKNGGEVPGLPTGFPDLDNMILGLNNSDLILVASRPGMGKTSIALNIALYVAKHTDKTVAVFSLEMSKEQLAIRLLSSEAYVDSNKLLTGRLSTDDWRNVAAAAAAISRTNIKIDDNPMLSVADMNAQCRRLDNLGLVIIDYLQLMQSASGTPNYQSESRTQAVGDISRMLKIMAKELNVPVICLSQLSRANVLRSNKRPVLSDLRESGTLEQDADIVLGLYRDDYYEEESDNRNEAELIVMKNRHGGTGTIDLQWLPEFTTYASVERRHEE